MVARSRRLYAGGRDVLELVPDVPGKALLVPRSTAQDFQDHELSGSAQPFKVRVYIEADDGTACEITKLGPYAIAGNPDPWYGRLVKRPSKITIRSELRTGVFAPVPSTIELRDDDRIFQTEPATFYDSGGGTHALARWYRARVHLRIAFAAEGGGFSEVPMYVFEIRKITPNARRRTVTVQLYGLERGLIDSKAKDIMEGNSWPENWAASQLVDALVTRCGKGRYTFQAGSPSDAETATDVACLSSLGNMPPLKPNQVARERSCERDFMPRFPVDISGADPAWVGYSISSNCPAVLYWNRTADRWYYTKADAAEFIGYEGAFAVPTGIFGLRVMCLSNRIISGSQFPMLNHAIRSFKVTVSSGVITYDDAVSYEGLNLACGVRPASLRTDGTLGLWQEYWGFGASGLGDDPAGTVYVDSKLSCPDEMGTAGDMKLHVGGLENAGGLDEPHYMSDVEAQYPGPDDYLDLDAEDWDLKKGCYHLFKNYRPSSTLDCPLRTWYHADISRSFRYNATRDVICWLAYRMYPPYANCFVLCKLNPATRAFSLQKIVMPTVSTWVSGADHFWMAHQVTAFDVFDEGGTAAVTIAASRGACEPGSGTVYSPGDSSSLYRFTWTAADGDIVTPSTVAFSYSAGVTSYAARYFPAIISITSTPGTASGLPIYGQVLNLWNPSGHCYGMWFWSSATINTMFGSTTYQFPTSAAPFCFSPAPVLASSKYRSHAIDQATGSLWELASTTPSVAVTAAALYFDPGPSELTRCRWSPTPPLATPATGGIIVFGAMCQSAPATVRTGFHVDNVYGWNGESPQLGPLTGGGPIQLWRYGLNMPPIVEVGDFASASGYNALRMLRDFCGDYVMGLDPVGAFYFKPRPTTYIMDIVERGDRVAAPSVSLPTAMAAEITSELDWENIINSVTVRSYVPTLEQPTPLLVLTPDSTADSMLIVAQQRGLSSNRVILTCISGGRPRDPDSTSEKDRPVLFTFARILDQLSLSLAERALYSAGEVRVFGLYTDAAGVVYIGDAPIRVGDYIRVGNGRQTSIVGFNVAEGLITVSGAIGVSGDGPFEVGTAVEVIPLDRYRFAHSSQGLCSASGAQNFTGGTIATLAVDTTATLSAGMVLWGAVGFYLLVLAILSPTTVRVMPGVLGSLKSGTAKTIQNTEKLKGAVWVRYTGKSYGVGNTGIAFSVFPGVDAEEKNAAFAIGDQIRIFCEGVKLTATDNVVSKTEDSASVSQYGPKEWSPAVENRLMTPARAAVALTTLIQNANPLYATVAKDCEFLPALEPSGRVRVWHSYYFGSTWVAHDIVGLEHDLLVGKTTIYLRSVPSGSRDANAPGTGGLPGVMGEPVGPVTSRRPVP
jgi:hypothetical protein